ncbi:MAG: hypothetical protein M0P55_15490 [Clostridiales bacterium]|nr:hypothetical protein [Clostridiales bacterium]
MIDLWTTKALQSTMALLLHLEGNGVTDMAGVRDYLQRRMDERLLEIRRINYRNKGIRRKMSRLVCSECGGAVVLYKVNVSKCSMVGGPWKTQAVCRRCGHEEFSQLMPVEIIRQGRL